MVMHELTQAEMQSLDGEGFWGGVGCGLGAVAALVSWTSPMTRLALMAYGGASISCLTAWY